MKIVASKVLQLYFYFIFIIFSSFSSIFIKTKLMFCFFKSLANSSTPLILVKSKFDTREKSKVTGKDEFVVIKARFTCSLM